MSAVGIGLGVTFRSIGQSTPSSVLLLGGEDNGFSLDFVDNNYAVRSLEAIDLITAEAQGFALDFVSNTYAVRTP